MVRPFLQLADSVDFADAGEAAEVCGEFGEVAEVEGFDDEFDVGGDAVGVGFAVDGADVGVVVGDGGGELFEHAGAVVAGDDEADGEAGAPGRGGCLADLGGAGCAGRARVSAPGASGVVGSPGATDDCAGELAAESAG